MLLEAIAARVLGHVLRRDDVQQAIDHFIDSSFVHAKDWFEDQRQDPDSRKLGSRLKAAGIKSAFDKKIRESALKQCILTGGSLFKNAHQEFHEIHDIAFLCPAELCQINTAIELHKIYFNTLSFSQAIPNENERALALLSLGYASVRKLLEKRRINYRTECKEYVILGDVGIIWGSRSSKTPLSFNKIKEYFLIAHFQLNSDLKFKAFSVRMENFLANCLSLQQAQSAGEAWTEILKRARENGNRDHCPVINDMQSAYVFCDLSKDH